MTVSKSSTIITNPTVAGFLYNMPRGRFVSLQIRKSGITRGRGADKKLYGDDLTRVVLITGFNYKRLVERSLNMLDEIVEDGFRMFNCEGPVTIDDFRAAADELKESFLKTIEGTNTSTTQDVYTTLQVDGMNVPGARVYIGDGAESGTSKGDVNLSGLLISEKVIELAVNGPIPPSNSASKTIAKNKIRYALPIGRYRSYTLRADSEYILRAGGDVLNTLLEENESMKVGEDFIANVGDWSDLFDE
jgi:hypothetical protein